MSRRRAACPGVNSAQCWINRNQGDSLRERRHNVCFIGNRQPITIQVSSQREADLIGQGSTCFGADGRNRSRRGRGGKMREHKTLTCGQPYVHNARVNSHLTEPCFDAKTVELFSIGYPDSGSGKGSCRLSADMLSERIDYSTVIWTHDSPDAEQHAAPRNEYSPQFAGLLMVPLIGWEGWEAVRGHTCCDGWHSFMWGPDEVGRIAAQ